MIMMKWTAVAAGLTGLAAAFLGLRQPAPDNIRFRPVAMPD